jgi:hypothetical protein
MSKVHVYIYIVDWVGILDSIKLKEISIGEVVD